MALLYDKVVSIVSKDPSERTDLEIEQILPWFRKKSELFKSQKAEIVKDILKNCQFMKCKRDHVIIKQGDKGDCFFIILNGLVSIHIQTILPEDGIPYDPSMYEERDGAPRRRRQLDKSIFGIMVGKIPAGKSFGELALINADCVRNASIIADEVTDLIVVNRELYSRSLKAFQEKEFNEKKTFVEEYPLFRSWPLKYKKQLAMSLRKEKITFDDLVVKQGSPVDGLRFLLSGQAKMLIEPVQHETLYPDKFPLPDIGELEKVEARESIRREMNMATPKQEERRAIYIRPRSANPADRKKVHKNVEVCVMGAVEIIGDLELTFGLPYYAGTALCTQEAEVFVLDQENYERLVEKRNPQTLDIMRNALHLKLKLRMSWVNEEELPLLRYFLYKLDERKRSEINRLKEYNRRKDTRDTIDYWRSGKLQSGPLIDQFGPGSVFYTIRMRAKVGKGQLRRKPNFGMGVTRHFASDRKKISAYDSNNGNDDANESKTKKTSNEFCHRKAFFSDEEDENEDMDDDVFDDVDGKKPRKGKEQPESNSPESSNAHSRSSRGQKSDYSMDEFMNHETNELLLSRLETRIEQWHAAVNEIDSGGRPSRSAKRQQVKLHRYNAEDHQKPFPGKKIILKPKPKAKPNMLTVHLETIELANRPVSPPASVNDPSIIASRDLTPRANAHDLWFVTETGDEDTGVGGCFTRRPQSSRSSRGSRGKGLHIYTRPKSARQYTTEDYATLKEELRRKQIAYKSVLMRSHFS